MEIDGLKGWTVLEMPGHAESHIVLFHEQEGRMIEGTCCCKTAHLIRLSKRQKREARERRLY